MLSSLFGRADRDETPQANGHPACAPEGTRIYAIGDIHGCADMLMQLQHAIREDAGTFQGSRLVAVYIGDYVDRGPNSFEVIDRLVENPLEGFENVHLEGNHESFMREFLEDTSAGPLWLMNGGDATCRSYGVDPLDARASEDRFGWVQEKMRAALEGSHRRFLDNLHTRHAEGDYLFVHAGVRPGVPLDEQDANDLIWIREPFLNSSEDFGKVVVHGHTPADKPQQRRNRIGIDTGAVYGGRLTAVVLEGDEQRYLQV